MQKAVQNKTGYDFVEVIQDGFENDKKQFDNYTSFNEILNKLKGSIIELAKDRTIIIVVDELDRCVPNYVIKVLERLHHIFDGVSNSVTILSIDRTQLEHSLEKIYGSDIDTEHYLKKFIDFRIKLDNGKVQNDIFMKYGLNITVRRSRQSGVA